MITGRFTTALAAGTWSALLAATTAWGAPQVHQAEVAQAEMQARLAAGKEGYASYCQSCHQPDGSGMPAPTTGHVPAAHGRSSAGCAIRCAEVSTP